MVNGTIAKGLKQFDNGRHSDAFYEALAWRGLKEHDVQAWKDLSPDRKQELDDIGLNIAYLTNSIRPNENE